MELKVGDKVIRKGDPRVGTIERIIPGNPYSGYTIARHDRAYIRWEPKRRWSNQTNRSTVRCSELLTATGENIASVTEKARARAQVRQASSDKKVAALRIYKPDSVQTCPKCGKVGYVSKFRNQKTGKVLTTFGHEPRNIGGMIVYQSTCIAAEGENA